MSSEQRVSIVLSLSSMKKGLLCSRTKSEVKYLRLPSHLKDPQALQHSCDSHSHPQLNTPTDFPFLNTKIEMITNIDAGAQYNELAISAINLNAESQAQGKSSLTYYRLFYLGKPVSEFSCKACHKTLGHMPPVRCGRCSPFADGLGIAERTIVGFSQLADGITVGEYLVERVELCC